MSHTLIAPLNLIHGISVQVPPAELLSSERPLRSAFTPKVLISITVQVRCRLVLVIFVILLTGEIVVGAQMILILMDCS